jgi:hypothetical protein
MKLQYNFESPEEFLKNYKQRQQIRKSIPDRVDENKQLYIPEMPSSGQNSFKNTRTLDFSQKPAPIAPKPSSSVISPKLVHPSVNYA